MKIAISIILFDSPIDILKKNIFMLSNQDFLDDKSNAIEIFFCDNKNGNQIKMVSEICNDYSNLKFQFIDSENVGFGSAHNKVFNSFIDKSYDYFLVMNPDGISHPRMLKNLTDFAIKNNNNGIFEALQFPEEHPKFYHKETKKTQWCSGCCCMFPVKIFEELGGFDDNFFMYMEDVDLSWRARYKGYSCYTVNDALFFHSVAGRLGNNQEILMNKSAYILATKYNDVHFKNKILTDLSKLIEKSDLEVFISNCIKNNYSQKYDNYQAITDFKNNFYFSEGRW